MPRDTADNIRTHLFVVAFLQDGSLEIPGPRQVLHIAAVTLKVAFELRQCQIMGLQYKEPKMAPATGVQRAETAFVTFGYRCDRHHIDIEAIRNTKGSFPAGHLHQLAGRSEREYCDHIDSSG